VRKRREKNAKRKSVKGRTESAKRRRKKSAKRRNERRRLLRRFVSHLFILPLPALNPHIF
jgi:hypothetical protein